MCNVRGIKRIYKWNERHVCVQNPSLSLSENQMHLKHETQNRKHIVHLTTNKHTGLFQIIIISVLLLQK